MASEVQSVVQEAWRAQQHEDSGDLGQALESYYRVSCQLAYFVDAHAQAGTPMADLCQGLARLYERRTEVLRSRQEGPQWVQLEQIAQTRPALNSDLTSSAATSTVLNHPSTAIVQQQLRLDQVQQQAVFAATAAGGQGGLEQVFEDPCSLSEGSSSQLELLRACQRTVSGTLDDVVGLEDVKLELEEAVFLPLECPHLFKGIRQPARTFLLYGPPGTGKTLLVEKVAAEAGFMLLSISPSLILSKWAGDSEKAISGVFDIARSFQPCIIFLDEVDSLGQSRDGNTDAGARRLLTELLIQFTRAVNEEGLYVFGATNRIQDCDPALLRRFSRRIEVPVPDDTAREAFFRSVLSRPEVDADLSTADICQLVQHTQGYSGSDLNDLCRTAALAPVRELLQRQRQQLGRKRRRLDLAQGLELPDLSSSRMSPDPDTAASHGADSSGAADSGGTSTQQVQQGRELQETGASAPSAAAGGAVLAPVAGAAGAAAASRQQLVSLTELRPLVLADFQAALQLVKPAAVDAEVRGS